MVKLAQVILGRCGVRPLYHGEPIPALLLNLPGQEMTSLSTFSLNSYVVQEGFQEAFLLLNLPPKTVDFH